MSATEHGIIDNNNKGATDSCPAGQEWWQGDDKEWWQRM